MGKLIPVPFLPGEEVRIPGMQLNSIVVGYNIRLQENGSIRLRALIGTDAGTQGRHVIEMDANKLKPPVVMKRVVIPRIVRVETAVEDSPKTEVLGVKTLSKKKKAKASKSKKVHKKKAARFKN